MDSDSSFGFRVILHNILIFKKLHLTLEVQAENVIEIKIYTFQDTCQLIGCTFLEFQTIGNQRCTHTV